MVEKANRSAPEQSIECVKYSRQTGRTAAALDENSDDVCVAVYDPKVDRIIARFTPPLDSVMDVAISPDGSLVAVGVWDSEIPRQRGIAGVVVWEVATSSVKAEIFVTQVSGLFFDQESQFLICKSEQGTFVFGTDGIQVLKIPFIEELRGGSFSARGNVFSAPIMWKGKVACVSFDPVRKWDIQLPLKCVLWEISHSPTDALVVAPEPRGGWVWCLEWPTLQTVWSHQIGMEADCCLGTAFCGDGTLVAVPIVRKESYGCLLVLESSTGSIVNEFTKCPTGRGGFGQPLVGTEVLFPSGGCVLDLATGEVSERIRAPFC
jgi:hypothetical protein